MLDFSSPFGRRVKQHLRKEHVLWLTTVDARGTPQPRPVWFLWDGRSFLIYSQPDTGKVRHIHRNPRVALHLNSDVHGDDFAVFLGEARVRRTRPAGDRKAAYLRKYRRSIKKLGMTPEGFFQAYSVPIEVRPEAMRGW